MERFGITDWPGYFLRTLFAATLLPANGRSLPWIFCPCWKGRQENVETSGKTLPKLSANGKGKASQIAARLTKSNSAYVAALKAISKTAPELIEKVRAGDLSVPDAKRLADIPKEKRQELLRQVNGQSHNGEFLREWKAFSTPKAPKPVHRAANERKSRINAATLIHGDCTKRLKELPSKSVDAIITDPIYPEVKREYGRITEAEWHSLMQAVVVECRRILKPKGSAVFIFQPNYEKIGHMRPWPVGVCCLGGEGMEPCSRRVLVVDRRLAAGWNRSEVRPSSSERKDVRVARFARLLSQPRCGAVDPIASHVNETPG